MRKERATQLATVSRMRWMLAVLLLAYSMTLATPHAVPPAPAAPVPILSDEKCSAWVVWDEARGEPLKGARAVLDAVLARMHKRNKTACEVVKERYQFQGYKPGAIQKVPDEALTRYEAVRKMPPVTANCEYFHATYVHPAWRLKMRRCKQVGKHIFYQPKENAHETIQSHRQHDPATQLHHRQHRNDAYRRADAGHRSVRAGGRKQHAASRRARRR